MTGDLSPVHRSADVSAYQVNFSAVAELPFTDITGYIALTAFAINVAVAIVLTLVARAARVPEGHDRTIPDDYYADADGE